MRRQERFLALALTSRGPARPQGMRPLPRSVATLAGLVAGSLLLGCASAPSGPDPIDPPPSPSAHWYFPPTVGSVWATARPSEAGFDSVALTAALDWAGTQQSRAVVVLWRGRLVAERYWNGWTTNTAGPWFSAGKTVTSALVTHLAALGRLSLDAPVRHQLGTGWSRAPLTEPAITIRHLLSMTSGLDDSLRFVSAPGSRFYYNNPAYYQLFGVLERASGQTVPRLADSLLFSRIGMSRTTATPSTDTGQPGFIFRGSARDFARFGLLMLHYGRWDGAMVLQDTASLAQARRWSGSDNQSYGWLWWLNGGASHRLPGPYGLPTGAGPLFPAAPADLVAALGLDDKKLYLVPSRDLVIVRLGDRAPVSGSASPAAVSSFDNRWWTQLTAAMR
jgi:CubicO group peptidase (beta-lactamase class C family)